MTIAPTITANATPAAPPYRLYGAFASLYTGKTRSYLRKKGIPFVEYLPCTPHFREHVTPRVGNRRIPMLEAADGTIVQDSTEIFDYLEARHPDPPALPNTPRQRLAAHLLELFAGDALARLAWHYRWNFLDVNRRFVLMDFGRSFRPQGSDDELLHYGGIIARQMEGKAPGMGLTPALYPVMDEIYHDLLDLLDAHFTHHPYLLGGLPSAGDFALMGPLFAHLGRDPYPLQVMQRRAPRVFRWVEHMNTPELRMPEFPDTPPRYLDDDEVTVPVAALLRLLIGAFGGQFLRTAELYDAWLWRHKAAPPGTPLSDSGEDQPSLGMVELTLRGHRYRCASNPHGLWLLQRALDHYRGLDGAGRKCVEPLITATGADAVLGITLGRRLIRSNYRLAVG